MGVVSAEATELFVGSASAPLQVVRVSFAAAGAGRVHVEGTGVSTPTPVDVALRGDVTVEVGVDTGGAEPGDVLPARAVVATGADQVQVDFDLVVASPGWTMFMVSHFHYDPVWWNTQAAYTTAWDELDFPGSPRGARQLAGFDLVRAHLDLALAEPAYRFVLAEVDYLKPYWDAHPEDRAVLRRLIAEGRVEVMGGAYNEPNTNLTDPETTIRNFVHGMGFQVDVLGSSPRTAWQLDAFGHDPAFPGFAADAGLTSSSWARGPFHQWGPMERVDGVKGDPERMQFPSEFEWVSPSGRGVLTSYMTDHYGSGWGMDSAPSLVEAGDAAYEVFLGLKKVATTRNVLLPVGGDYTPPNKWITALHHDWARRYVWPRFVCAVPRDFFAAVRAELAERGVAATPQTRDMNPIYTGKDVSYIDTKQAQRAAETALLEAESYATFASLLTGSDYPDAALAKAWVQLAYGAHHDGITGSESDQVYLDLLTSWRDAHDLGTDVRDRSLTALSAQVDTGGSEIDQAIVVWNPLDHARTDVVTVRLADPVRNVTVDGRPTLVEHGGRSVSFVADVPAFGWRAYRLRPSEEDSQGWVDADGTTATNAHHRLTVDPDRGGGVASLVELAGGRELIAPGRVGNELAVYDEYPQHPRFSEGPWHLLPKGPVVTSAAGPATVRREVSPLGERLTVTGTVGPVGYTQTITLWQHTDRIDCVTTVDEFTGSDQLLRVRWPCPVPGALPVSEVGNAVVGRGFGLIDVDSAQHPWTLDNPAHTWFGLSATAAVRLADGTTRPIGVAEIVVPAEADAAPLARDLAVALARSGVTATVSHAHGARYGNLDVDSNLPDVRFSIGGPDDNAFTAEVLDRAGATVGDHGAYWVPAEKPLTEVWRPSADLRDARALGVLVLTGADLPAVVRSIVDDLADHVIEAAGTGESDYAGHTVALLNRGLPGFAVDAEGTLHASLLRSCTGWPSGVWIDPPRRTVPDGSNFQLQHWTHRFEYAIVAGDGDWRQAGVAATSAGFSRPLLGVPTTGGGNLLPDNGSLLTVEPAGQVRLAAVKAAGNPLPAGSATLPDPHRVALRLVGHLGEPVTATVRSDVLDLTDPATANLLERDAAPLSKLAVPVDGCDAVTVLATARPRKSTVDPSVLGAEAEPAQPLYAKYWLHNRGPAPLGGLPAAVHVTPTAADIEPGGSSTLRLTVASDCTDAELTGVVVPRLPTGWRAEPDQVPFGLPAGGHLDTELTVHAPANADPGRYPVRVGVELAGSDESPVPPSWRQVVEDVAVLSVPGETEAPADLLRLVEDPSPVRLAPGERGTVRVRVASAAHAPLAVEAALISPWGTWEFAGPRAVGAEVPALGEAELTFDVTPPPWTSPSRTWALIRVVGAGRILYSPAVPLEVLP
jgi:alpha-mannosidase